MKRIAFISTFLFAQLLLAQSRLPFLINNTSTLEAGKKEFSLGLSTSSTGSSITFFIPNLNFTYGITNRLQIEMQSSLAFYFFGAQDAVAGGTNGILGLKYLLLGNPKDGISFSVAPQQSFPFFLTKDDSRLNPRESITLLPLQMTMRGSDSYILVEFGLEKHSLGFNNKLMAMAFGKFFTPEFETMIEYYLRVRENSDTEKNSIVNIGGRYHFDPNLQFLVSLGGTTAIFAGEESTYYSYFGVKWIWGGASAAAAPARVPQALPATAVPAPAPARAPQSLPSTTNPARVPQSLPAKPGTTKGR